MPILRAGPQLEGDAFVRIGLSRRALKIYIVLVSVEQIEVDQKGGGSADFHHR
jgi:hypothetical protein